LNFITKLFYREQ